MGSRINPTRIQCVNCNVCINTIRRYPALALDTRVTSLLCTWVYPYILTDEDYVCEACRDLAIHSVNIHLQQEDTQHDGQTAGSSHRGHSNICILCGCSIARRQSDLILRENHTELHESMINIISERVAPRQILTSDRACHACWLRIRREACRPAALNVIDLPERAEDGQPHHNQNVEVLPERAEDGQPHQEHDGVIALSDYRRAANSNNHCVFPDCNARPLHGISDKLRATILKNHHYYVPNLARVCGHHLTSNIWDMLYDSSNSSAMFTVQQIQHVFSFVNEFNPTLDFENIEEMDGTVFEYWIGRTKDEFFSLQREVPRLMELQRGSLGLAALLLKMRTGDSDDRIATLMKVPRRTLENYMHKAREILLQDFVPRNLGIRQLSREDLLRHNLLIPTGLYGNGRNAIVICDGTYIYIHKSANYSFQKQSYSLHKYRNLLKPFLLVACDGYIVDCFGPYKATTSDADIMTGLFHEGSALRNYFRENDIFILDRGFRDSIRFLEECGYKPYMPDSLLEDEQQLTTEQANRSRCVTICRWVIEAVNGHFKRDFKIFRQQYFNHTLPHMMQNFQIAAALLNRFGVRFQNSIYANEILEIIRERMQINNNLAIMVNTSTMNRRRAQFESITADRNNLRYFPTLEYRDLILFALGTYQVRQARSYYGEHIRFHGGYRIEVCSEPIDCAEHNLRGNGDTTLIRGIIKSRHITSKKYYVYIVIQNNIPSRLGITDYCCSCLVGRRTVGCCAHVMTMVWFLGWARHQNNISAPAEFLDDLIIRDDEYDDEE